MKKPHLYPTIYVNSALFHFLVENKSSLKISFVIPWRPRNQKTYLRLQWANNKKKTDNTWNGNLYEVYDPHVIRNYSIFFPFVVIFHNHQQNVNIEISSMIAKVKTELSVDEHEFVSKYLPNHKGEYFILEGKSKTE